MKIDLNCDLGEGIGNDEAIMPFITSANIACGFHAGDEKTMRETIRLAKKYHVNIGAHPSWEDRENFGRKEMNLSPNETEKIVRYQIELFAKICKEENAILTHVKPHGALYNQSARDVELARAIAQAIKNVSQDSILVGLAGSRSIEAGIKMGLKVAREGFPDRRYNSDGSLMSRNISGAVIESSDEVAHHALTLILGGGLDTLCLHGDNLNAAENAKLLRSVLEKNGIEVVGIR
ncbi:MAG: LamB/YcsF family protein [Anaerolineales bacterium]|nr:LamB/YcsF family protein [Anaerolineales bacterium]